MFPPHLAMRWRPYACKVRDSCNDWRTPMHLLFCDYSAQTSGDNGRAATCNALPRLHQQGAHKLRWRSHCDLPCPDYSVIDAMRIQNSMRVAPQLAMGRRLCACRVRASRDDALHAPCDTMPPLLPDATIPEPFTSLW